MKLKKLLIPSTSMLFIVMLLAALSVTSVFAFDSSPRFPGTGTNVTGTGTVNWTNAAGLTADDANYANVNLDNGETSNYLQGTNFGFTIPTDATITRIVVEIDRWSTGLATPYIQDATVRLVKGGVIVGTNNAHSGVNWSTADAVAIYSPGDPLWGTSWTPAEINASNFGVVLSATNPNLTRSRQGHVDFFRITVSYTLPTSLSVNPVTATYGDTINLSATLTPAVVGKSVNFTLDGVSACSGPTNASGVATCQTTLLTKAGTYATGVEASFAGDADYGASSNTASLTVNKADPTCIIMGYTITYDGNPHKAAGSCKGVQDETLAGLDLGASFTNVPGGTADWTFTDVTGNYTDIRGSVDITITKADPVCSVDGFTGVYDGDPHGATGSCTGVKGETLTGLVLGSAFTDVPGGTANWTFTDVTGNYNGDSGSVPIVISKADPTCVVDGYTNVYDGESHGATGSCTGVKDELLDGLDLGASFTNVPGGNAEWIFTDDTGNYNDDSGSVPIDISKADPTCDISGYTDVYDGDPHGATGTCTGVKDETLDGLVLGASFTNVPGGSAEWTFTDVTGNYNDDSGSVPIEISKADPTCGVTGYLVEYDRLAHTATGSCKGVKLETLTGLDLSGTTHTDIGVYAADPWTFTDGTGNYNDDAGTVQDEITKRAITVTADAKTKKYGQPDPPLTYKYTGTLLSGDDFTGDLTREPGESLGTYAILQGTLSLPADFYQITYIGANFSITGISIFLPIIMR